MPKYYLSKTAEDDLREIIEYTFAEWGIEQVFKFRDSLDSRLATLAKFPEVGRKNINLPEYIIYVVEGKHYVFYKVVDDGIEVIRFLHSKMDIFNHISKYL